MSVVCPTCATRADLDPGPTGQMMRCGVCGTEWMARRFTDNPFTRQGVGPVDPNDIEDAEIIDHVAPDFGGARREEMATSVGPTRRFAVRGAWKHVAVFAIACVVVFVYLSRPGDGVDRSMVTGSVPKSDFSALEFERIRSEISNTTDGRRLMVEGRLINASREHLYLPSIKVAVKGAGGETLQEWRIDLAVPTIGPRGSVGFRSAVAYPHGEASDVNLTLAPRRENVSS